MGYVWVNMNTRSNLRATTVKCVQNVLTASDGQLRGFCFFCKGFLKLSVIITLFELLLRIYLYQHLYISISICILCRIFFYVDD